MAVHEVRLPIEIERGAVGGPRFKTLVFEGDTGHEQRDIKWARTRGEWDISYGILPMEEDDADVAIHDIRDFFYAREGKAHAFRFKDWADFQIGDPDDPANDHQNIGLGDDSTVDFQIFKEHVSGGISYNKAVYKIVDSTYFVYIDDVLQVEGGGDDYTIDIDTGIITFNSPPAGGEIVQVACEYDYLVRFDTDHLNISIAQFNAGSLPALKIVELRLES